MNSRTETDAYGEIALPQDAYWGPQTERSRRLFTIGDEKLPRDVIRCFGAMKAAAARANLSLHLLEQPLAGAVIQAAEEMEAGGFDDQFPIVVWQTGSGTQTNMNANEVIANRANEILGQPRGSRSPVHPNDHVNLGQSSNDTFPTIMHISTLRAIFQSLEPAVQVLRGALSQRADDFHDFVKLGMTHLQDALPVTLGSEFRVWERQIDAAWTGIAHQASVLLVLPQGGTASGSGVNGHADFAQLVAVDLCNFVGKPLIASALPAQLMAAHDGFAGLSGALNVLATALLKICNDIRLLTSSLGGIPCMTLPDEGLSSSIMPAKRNATVCEAVIQVCLRVLGNSATVLAANASGTLQLNTCKPLILNEVLDSIRLLSDAQCVLATGCIEGLQADRSSLQRTLHRSPVLGTVLAPIIGYDIAADVIRDAAATGKSIREIVQQHAVMDIGDFDAHLARILDPNQLDKRQALDGPKTSFPKISADT